MNLLIIPSWYPSKGMPVNGVFFKEQAEALSRAGHSVTVVDVSFHGRKDVFNSKNFRLSYVKDCGVYTYSYKIPSFYVLSRIKSLHIWIYKVLLFFVFKRIRKKGIEFDVIHAHSFQPAGYCACKLSEKYSIPLVVTEHSSKVLKEALTKKEQQMLHDTINKSNAFICVSQALRKSIYKQIRGCPKLLVVPNMVSPLFLHSGLKNDRNEFIFLSVGLLNENKRHGFTISCFMEAFKSVSNVKLQIAGDGELYQTLEKQISENKLSEKVQLLGLLNKEQLKTKIEQCKVFILVSAFETFGIAYIEAMACGKPVIAAKNGGANEIVNDANGILIERDDKDQLVEAFRYMYNNVSKYDGKQIAADCRLKYSEESVAKMLFEIYNGAQRDLKMANES